MKFTVRSMELTDFDSIMEIQSLCFSGGLPEQRASLLAKFHASPASCFVIVADDNSVVSYLFAVPWVSHQPPALDQLDCNLPSQANCLYLHDLSVHPKARGHQLGDRLVKVAFAKAKEFGFTQCCLVAVQESKQFWARHGFAPVQVNVDLANKISTYGEGAHFMAVVLA